MAGNRVLHEHPLLIRINKIRERLAGSDRTDHIQDTIEWERRAKRALIMMNARGHEGIQMIMEKAKEEIAYRNNSLATRRPEDMSPEGMHKYTTDRSLDFLALDMWLWFLNLFIDADQEMKDLEATIAIQEQPDPDEYMGGSSPTDLSTEEELG
jgi:hypothetical protein